jgi:hypothetical protein
MCPPPPGTKVGIGNGEEAAAQAKSSEALGRGERNRGSLFRAFEPRPWLVQMLKGSEFGKDEFYLIFGKFCLTETCLPPGEILSGLL